MKNLESSVIADYEIIGEITFLETVCNVIKTYYLTNGNIALELVEKETGEPFLVASTNLSRKLKDGEVYIKNYSENEGIKRNLINNKFISEAIDEPQQGITIHKLLK